MPMKSSPSKRITSPGGDPDAQRQHDVGALEPARRGRACRRRSARSRSTRTCAVAAPLPHPDPVVGRELAHQRAERGEHLDGFVVAERVVHAREAAHVDERKAPVDPHRPQFGKCHAHSGDARRARSGPRQSPARRCRRCRRRRGAPRRGGGAGQRAGPARCDGSRRWSSSRPTPSARASSTRSMVAAITIVVAA